MRFVWAGADSSPMKERMPESLAQCYSCRTSRIEVQIHAETVRIITLRGEHDLGTTPAIEAALATVRGQNILVDVSGASFIDSSVINTLLGSAEAARAHACAVELVAAYRGFPRRVLELAGIQQILPVHADLAAGLASMDARQS
jgi:anti-anti-sigma factor